VSIDLAPAHSERCQMIFDAISATDPNRLQLVVGDSRVPLPNRHFGCLFVDGDHSYEGVKADTLAHWNALRSHDGRTPIAIFHDAVPSDGLAYANEISHKPGVVQFCKELVDGGCAQVITSAGTMLWLEKISDISA